MSKTFVFDYSSVSPFQGKLYTLFFYTTPFMFQTLTQAFLKSGWEGFPFLNISLSEVLSFKWKGYFSSWLGEHKCSEKGILVFLTLGNVWYKSNKNRSSWSGTFISSEVLLHKVSGSSVKHNPLYVNL